MLSTTHTVELSRAGLEHIGHMSFSDMLWQVRRTGLSAHGYDSFAQTYGVVLVMPE